MSLDRAFARFVTHRRRTLFAGVVALVAASALVIAFGARFTSDVLDLLPQHFNSVRAFKTFDREFSQAHELTFALLDETRAVDLDAFAEHFGETLRKEPWVTRVMDRSPMESPGGIGEVRAIALPMLLNLDDTAFDRAIRAAEPGQIAARLKKLRAELAAGSPKAEFELDFDPLGLVTPALQPLAGSFSIEQTRPLASADGTLRIVLAKTSQRDLGAHACQATMDQAQDFQRRVLAAWSGPAPQILVTGRTPYVGELSRTMRGDVLSTILGSIGLVAVVFFAGFRRITPLLAIMVVLLLCCIVAVALGALVYRELNMITIGLCAILIGLGVDFGMMLYAIYERERTGGLDHERAVAAAIREHGSGILFGALTTAVAFLCFLRSDSTGFAQFGVLIAIGILLAGFFMMTVFFAFLGSRFRRHDTDWLRVAGQRFTDFVYRHPRAFFLAGTSVLTALTAFAGSPFGVLHFDANPRSLEPPHSRAGHALRTIQAKMPVAAEPLIVLVEARDAEEFHARWARLQTAFTDLIARGRIKASASPAGFAVSPRRIESNAAKLRALDLPSARTALTESLSREGLSPDSFQSAFALLDALQSVAAGDRALLDWRKALPENSGWWFVLDRFFSKDPNLGAAYITPTHTLANFAEKEQLRADLEAPGVPLHISGWSYTLQDLVPWAKGKLTELSVIMIFFNALLLLVLYRRVFPLFILLVSLALSIGAVVASLKVFGIPLNMFNALAFPLILGVGVDYGIYVVIAMRHEGDPRRNLATIVKPVLLSGLTTVCGFGSLVFAANPALRGLGAVCALGVGWCLVATLGFMVPAFVWRGEEGKSKFEVRDSKRI
jgi:predicted RND superfamily exporter protein